MDTVEPALVLCYTRQNKPRVGFLLLQSGRERFRMYNHFLQIKSLEGELKMSHKKRDFGITVSTKELVYQKPHVNYIVKLEHIVTITPFEADQSAKTRRGWKGIPTYELQGLAIGKNHYRIYTSAATMHSRSGIFPLEATEFILPLLPDVLESIARYGQLNAF